MAAEIWLSVQFCTNRVVTPITLFEDKVLDGWHRYQACLQTGAKPHYKNFAGDDVAARRFVVSANLMRRHLDTSQRAMVAGRFATMDHGGDRNTKKQGANLPLGPVAKSAQISQAQSVSNAAELFNVAPRSVKDARVVLAKAAPEVIAKVERGEVSVSRAAKEIRAAEPIPLKPRIPRPSGRHARFG